MTMLIRSLPLALILWISACASIPQQELAAYTTAVNGARAAGELMVQDWQSASAELDRREAASKPARPAPAPEAIPLTWTPSSVSEELSAEKVRLLAWETIGEYTNILAALNAGESVDVVKSSTGRLFDVAKKVASASGSSIPGGEALVTLVTELAVQLEKARLSKEFKKAIIGGAPTIREMLAVFRKDTVDHYRLRASLAAEDLALVEAVTTLSKEEIKTKELRIIAEIDEFRNSLAYYVRLLDQMKLSLDALVIAVDQPIDFVAHTNTILDIAANLKQHWAAYQNARSEAKL